MSEQQVKPLWTDEMISEAYLNWQRTAVGRVDVTAFVRHIKDDYQAALDEANARIAAQEQRIAELEIANAELNERLRAFPMRVRQLETDTAHLRAELADALLVAIARGDKLGYVDADNDWRERYKQLTGRDYDESEGDDDQEHS